MLRFHMHVCDNLIRYHILLWSVREGAIVGVSILVSISGDEAANGEDNELCRMFAILLVI
jgi:hypothetical protein